MRISRWIVTPALAALCVAGSQGSPVFKAPSYTRAQMNSSLRGRDTVLVVYGTRDPAATSSLRRRGVAIARRLFGGDSGQVHADHAVSPARVAAHSVLLIGGPRENQWTARLAPALPVQFSVGAFRWQGRAYDRPGDVLHLVYPNPYEPRRFLLLIAGNSVEATTRHGGGFLFGREDWRILRDGELVRSGVFGQSPPWRYDPALDRDREAERARFTRTLAVGGTGPVRVSAPPDAPGTDAVRAQSETLLERLDRAGLSAPKARSANLTLYRSLEQKGALTRITRPEHLDASGGAHAAPGAGTERLDLWSIAAARLFARGAARDSRFLEPAGRWFAGRSGGEPLDVAVSRVYFGRWWPSAGEAAERSAEWRSPLVRQPARAVLVGALLDVAGERRTSSLLDWLRGDPPGTLDSLSRRAGVDPKRLAARYGAIADSMAREGLRAARTREPRPWRPEDGFQRGVCLAHAVDMEAGYLSAACARELGRLRGMGVSWISLTPFGYLPSLETPEIFPSAEGGPDEETDEAICEAAARARALGLRVVLKPHLWSRGWVGGLKFRDAEWPRFFERYREFMRHYALLAQRERMDGLVVGHELVTASLGHAGRWRTLIADTRRVYTGTLTYGANWDREAAGVAFWDALDLIGVSFYAPLAGAPTRDARTLREGADRALGGLRQVASRHGRPVVLLEVGYAAHASAPVEPWTEQREAIDVETQRLCYEAVVRALEHETWVAGVFWWKWFSSERVGESFEGSFSPRGRPAELVMSRALRSWQGRPVHPPAASAPDTRPRR